MSVRTARLFFGSTLENRQRRIEMDQIAVINIRNGEVKPQGQRTLTEADQAEIARWMEERKALLAQRDIDDIHRAVDYLNLTTQWAQSKATEDQLEDVTDRLAAGDARSAQRFWSAKRPIV